MNPTRLVARLQVRTHPLAAGVTSHSMQLRKVGMTALKEPAASQKAMHLLIEEALSALAANIQAEQKVDAKMNDVRKNRITLKKPKLMKQQAHRMDYGKAKTASTEEANNLKSLALKASVAQRQKALEEETAAAKKAAREARAKVRAAINSSGSVRPFSLFIQKAVSGRKGGSNVTALAAQWKALSEDQKQQYRVQAKKNLATRNATRLRLKANSAVKNKYALFIKNNFAAAYEAAKKTNSTPRGTFRAASAAVAKKYKSQ
eukprot:TRINITY_DN260_c0_g1_i5.p1 TRINITY_DN260_c0_g1~~TRINITY_DN260_c0_g1_i5.p1  ORF type:complete len:261 (+),score=49.06 TRINITY_DN260_c0_g1_i5:50-832(+)